MPQHGLSYELEQPVSVHLDHDDVLASGDGHVYVHDPFPAVRTGLYLFNTRSRWYSTPGIGAVECFIRFDTFDRPIAVPKDEATHALFYSPAGKDGPVPVYEELSLFKRWADIGSYLPVEREESPLTEADTEYWELDWQEQREVREKHENTDPTPGGGFADD